MKELQEIKKKLEEEFDVIPQPSLDEYTCCFTSSDYRIIVQVSQIIPDRFDILVAPRFVDFTYTAMVTHSDKVIQKIEEGLTASRKRAFRKSLYEV